MYAIKSTRESQCSKINVIVMIQQNRFQKNHYDIIYKIRF